MQPKWRKQDLPALLLPVLISERTKYERSPCHGRDKLSLLLMQTLQERRLVQPEDGDLPSTAYECCHCNKT